MENIKKISDVCWEIPTSYKPGMKVPARIYASDILFKNMDKGVFDQITNVACLPGIQKAALCMPDGHWGYGFPIGGVAAFAIKEGGIISPGGVGFDINCGIRIIKTNLTIKEVQPKLKELVDELFKKVPAGVGSTGFVKLNKEEFDEVITKGVEWCIENGYGWKEDLERTEENGRLKNADHNKISNEAVKRGINQLGTLGSGNHFLEIELVDKIFNENIAKTFGITEPGQVCIIIHCGSRGFGHQVATDYLRVFDEAVKKYKIEVKDRELVCAPFESEEGQDYFKAMACAANNAFANRQVIMHRVREVFSHVFKKTPEEMEMHLIYDVAHNIAKLEKYKIDGIEKEVVVHRKGATRAFGPGCKEIPEIYRKIGQPVIIGGSMETGSYLLVGTKKAMEETFGSTAHGSGRVLSRAAAKKQVWGEELKRKMEEKGIIVRAVSLSGLAEEAGSAYKNLDEVAETTERAGISQRIVKLKPIANIKG
ncbi:MAG: RtcB family protein [Candidatus Aenigmatarchaeota archaeon]